MYNQTDSIITAKKITLKNLATDGYFRPMEQLLEYGYTITLDNDPNVHSTIAIATGLESMWFSTFEQLEAKSNLQPVGLFLDVKMSLESSLNGSLIPKLKDVWPLSPIILTSIDNSSEQLTEAMALGADDFIAKPFNNADLANRFKIRKAALEKRAARETVVIGDMTIDTLQRSVVTGKGQKYLSPTEIKLLSELAKAKGGVVSREILKTRCWPGGDVTDNALNRKLYEIRRRIKPLSAKIDIRTVYGVGFVMEEK
jgi:DNA-binding response OmpR family regulator